ncbi:MAG: lysylphosphatidylglycerol synthase transmembrane domain-containing protein, partial [Candidatus Woesearchaeota archaeon]
MSSIKETERWFIAVVFLISASIFIKAIEQIGIDKIKHLIFGVNVSYIFLAILSGFFSLLIMSKKWHIVVKKVTRVNFKQIVPIYFAGSAIDMIASGSSVGGEPYRAAKLAKIQKKPFSDCLATTITEKIHSIIAFFILSTIAAIWAIFFFEFSPAVAFTFIIGAIFIISNAMILIYFRKEKFLNAINEALDVSLNKIYDSWLFEKLRKKFSTEEKFERKVISTVDSFIKQTHVLCRD